MEQFLGYGNVIFWIGLLLMIFLAGCDFFYNNMNVTLAEYHVFRFPQHPRMQKVCRILFVLTLILALFARIGLNWDTRPYTLSYGLICFISVSVIYYVICYSFVIVFLWVAKFVWKCISMLLLFVAYTLIWLQYTASSWRRENKV